MCFFIIYVKLKQAFLIILQVSIADIPRTVFYYVTINYIIYNYNKKECPYFGSIKPTCFKFTGGAVSIIAQ